MTLIIITQELLLISPVRGDFTQRNCKNQKSA